MHLAKSPRTQSLLAPRHSFNLPPREVQRQVVQFDAIGLQADIHAELLQQIELLSQAISDNIEEGILPTAPVELMTVKD
ncbi:hypothetical protein ACE02B_19910 [Shewanella mangrovisoli]|uniref:hypothetical protein n=1 Tax=Shewanella mangrovisoli TaxID=2864211 RepID=UPI0035B918C2